MSLPLSRISRRKGLTYGGSKVRLEAAGSGTVYFLDRMVTSHGDALAGKTIAVSGFGNMAPAAPPMGRPVRAFL